MRSRQSHWPASRDRGSSDRWRGNHARRGILRFRLGCVAEGLGRGKALTHSGSNTYNFAVAWLAPNRKFGVIAATNICASTTPGSMDTVIGRMIEYHLSGR